MADPATTRLANTVGYVYEDNDSYTRFEDEEGRDMVTDAYDASKTYAEGALCINDNKLYKAASAIETAEVWTPDHWTQTDINTELSSLNTKLDSYFRITTGALTSNIGGSMSGYWKKCGHLVLLSGKITNISLSASGWVSVCNLPFNTNGTQYIHFPLIDLSTGTVRRDGFVATSSLDAWLASSDSGNTLNFQASYFTNS